MSTEFHLILKFIDSNVISSKIGRLSHIDTQTHLKLVPSVIHKGTHNEGGREWGQALLQHASYYAPTVYHA